MRAARARPICQVHIAAREKTVTQLVILGHSVCARNAEHQDVWMVTITVASNLVIVRKKMLRTNVMANCRFNQTGLVMAELHIATAQQWIKTHTLTP